MNPEADYHNHTFLCGHASGKPYQYVEQAIKSGLKMIGFSDHAPLVSHEDRSIAMGMEQLPQYHKLIEDVRSRYAGMINILVGIEADFIPGYEEKTKAILNGYPYDYVYGSVHFIEEWGFDNPIQLQVWDEKDIDDVYRQYFNLLRKSAQSKMYDILAHVDLVKKFGHRPSIDLTAEIEKTAAVFKESGVIIEINTSGLRKPVKEMYPSLHDLKIYSSHKVPIVFGSDAHRPQDVGKDFGLARDLAMSAGYKDYIILEKRKIKEKKKL